MSDPRLARVAALFDRLADRPEADWAAVLAGEPDGSVRDEARALLVRDRTGGAPIAETIARAAKGLPAPSAEARRLGPYRIVGELGRGGMGVVFEAVRDDASFDKRVAIKVATSASLDPELVRRFLDERQILARLEHPNIARLLDGGTTPEGTPYLVMELVEGTPITEAARRDGLGLRDRLQLFLQVCDAVEYAHQSLVVHRDLTPRNILVAGRSVRLLDFGVAKLLDQGDAGMTRPGLAPLTLAYCSPEQLRGEAVTTRTDVYALGLLLFELLTGTRGQQADTSSRLALERSICETPVPSPSAIVAARGDRAEARRLAGDLDAIVRTATSKAPERRYPSAAALAEDVRRHLTSRPVMARADSRAYRLARFARRQWLPLAATAVVITSLTGGIVVATAQARRAERRFQEVRRIANALMGDVHDAIRDLPASAPAQAVVVRTAVEYLDGLTRDAGADPALRLEIAEGYLKLGRLASSLTRTSLGRPEDVAAYYDKAEALLGPLGGGGWADRAGPIATRLRVQRAEWLFDQSRTVDAQRLMEEALAEADRAAARHPDDLATMRAHLEVLTVLLASFDTSPAAVREGDRIVTIAEEVARRLPGDADARLGVGVAHSLAGKMAASRGDNAAAIAHYRRNAEIQEALVREQPENLTARRSVMLAWSTMADLALGPLGTGSWTGAGGPPRPLDPESRRQALDAANRMVAEAEWIRARNAGDDSAAYDHAMALGRRAPAHPPGDPAALADLDAGIATLERLEPKQPERALRFLMEFRGSRVERLRQAGRFAEAEEEWTRLNAAFHRAEAANPESYVPRRQMIPPLQNRAEHYAAQGDRARALAFARQAEQFAADVAAKADQYARAPGWPPRVRAWTSTLYGRLGDVDAARRAREESVEMWRAVAARTDVPADLVEEARRALADAGGEAPGR
ncbi:MAG: serine/threonine-protein kinase [Vicinamibacterales bacterium]